MFKIIQSIDVVMGIWTQVSPKPRFFLLFHSDFQYEILVLASCPSVSHCWSTGRSAGHIFPEYWACFLCSRIFLISTHERQHSRHVQKQLEINTILSLKRIWKQIPKTWWLHIPLFRIFSPLKSQALFFNSNRRKWISLLRYLPAHWWWHLCLSFMKTRGHMT